MNRRVVIAAAAVGFIAAALAASSLFVVDQNTQAVVLEFGRPIAVINPPGRSDAGLGMKAPWDTLVRLDKRGQGLDASMTEVRTSDQQPLEVQAYLRYRIDSPIAFYDSVGDEATAHDRLDRLVGASLGDVLGAASSSDVLAGRTDALMQQAANLVAVQAKAERIGVEIVDLRLRRASLSQANADAVYSRMRSERQQLTDQIKATADQRRRDILAKAAADRDATLAAADADASRIRGEGDAKRAELYAASFGRDPDFAGFYRAMLAYDAALGQGDTTFVLSPDSAFLKYMKQGPNAH